MSLSSRVLIVDDHRLFADLLSSHLRQIGIEVAGQAQNGAQALELIAKVQPDLVILDISLGAESGVHVAKTLLDRFPAIKIMVLSTYSDPAVVRTMIDLGAVGFVSKSSDFSELQNCIQVCTSGGVYISHALRQHYSMGKGDESKQGFLRLTARERKVVAGLLNGKSAKQVAADLGLSVKTVYVFQQNALEKLGVESIVELMKKGFDAGYDRID